MRALGVMILAIGTAVGAAPPAAADESSYLSQLQPKFAYLTPEQLLTEGFKACAYVSAGRPTPGAIDMVSKDLEVNAYTATTIVLTAGAEFDC